MQDKKIKSFSTKENKFKSIEAERFIRLIEPIIDKDKGISWSKIAKAVGFSSQDFTDIKAGKKDLQRNFLDAITNKYGIDKNFVLTGEKGAKTSTILNDILSSPESGYKKTPLIDKTFTGIPVYDFPNSISNEEFNEGRQPVGHLMIPGVTNDSFALPVRGESMNPILSDGNLGVVRPIDDLKDIEWGHVYFLEYGDYKVWKRLLKNEDDHDSVILSNENQVNGVHGQPKYASKIIKLERIKKLYILTDILIRPSF